MTVRRNCATTPGSTAVAVGYEAQKDEGKPFEEKMARWVAPLHQQQAEVTWLEAAIAANLEVLSYGLPE